MLTGMPFSRRHLLYAMLGALGLAALSGVLALLISDTGAVWRIAGTSFAAAIAAAIMIPMSGWADKPLTRLAGLLGMGVAVGELLLAALLIWGDFFQSDFREFLAWAVGILGVGGLIAVRFLKDAALPTRVWTARVGCGATVVAMGLFFAAAFVESFGNSWTTAEKFVGSGWSLFVSGAIAAFALLGWARPDPRWWRWIGVAAAVAAMGMTNYGIWIHSGGEPVWVVAAYCLAAVIAHAIACLRPTLTRGQSWVRIIAIGAAACAGGFATFASAIDRGGRFYNGFEWEWRGTAAFGLICVSATLALLVFGRLNRKPAVELVRSTTTFDRVSITCPRCEKRLILPVGGALCEGCRLHISVTIQSARCARCNYDLIDLRADKCPECGEPIPMGVTGLSEAT